MVLVFGGFGFYFDVVDIVIGMNVYWLEDLIVCVRFVV